jgi:DNA-binding NtrC family response regulator/tetratricopeptide (TPR) repeat protein
MHRNPDSLLQNAVDLIRRGRFNDARLTLQSSDFRHNDNSQSQYQQSLLCEVLHLTGDNEHAESIALKNLKSATSKSELAARFHLVLGNIYSERGLLPTAISEFQAAERLAGTDFELLSWVQLRLIATIAEVAGIQIALGRLPEVKRVLTRFGQARQFAALHLWIAEIESVRGSLDDARRHLRIAESLLSQIDDVWLQGYFAINSFGVCCYSGEIVEACKWAETALTYSKLSGHRGARRAANANLGYIQFSLGHLSRAEECLEFALKDCEEGSLGQIAVLHTLALIQLQRGDLINCEKIIERLERLSNTQDSKTAYYRAWATQAKIQFLLKQGRTGEARELCSVVEPMLQKMSQTRVRTSLRLLIVDTLAASDKLGEAANLLGLILSDTAEFPLDLFAEVERVLAKIRVRIGSSTVGNVNSQRAIRTFELIGHSIGKKSANDDSGHFPQYVPDRSAALVSRLSLDRLRSLFDTRSQLEHFGHEALNLLMDLNCAESNVLVAEDTARTCEILYSAGANVPDDQLKNRIKLELGTARQRRLRLEFILKDDPASILTGRAFERVVKQILRPLPDESLFATSECLWLTNEWLPNGDCVFASESMLDILKTVGKISGTDLSVLLTGETGTGKEVLAKAIHQHSTRVAKPFIALNCAAVPRELLESQLFGYRRGAFSGANESFQGVIKAANGGTLLLDEIGEIPLEIQPKLLRFLESGEIHPLGEVHPTKIDVRLLFATNANLAEAVKQGRFREDLFFRINVIPIRIPPLRERREEIPLLVNLFAHRFSREMSREPAKFAPETMESLILYSWPGNVRQLGNEVRRLVAMTDEGATIGPHDLSLEISRADSTVQKCLTPSQDREPIVLSREQSLAEAVTQLERSMISYALAKTSGQVRGAAQMLGLSRKGLYLKRQRLGLMPSSTQAPGFDQTPPSDRS